MSIDRQFGVYEIPGTETEAPNQRREVSAGFEGQMRDYVGAIWLKMGELERKVVNLEEWREDLDYRRVSPEQVTLAEARGEAVGGSPNLADQSKPSPKPSSAKARGERPWADEGVSKATWYRRHKEATA
jgi:hypothetical protein